MLNSLSVKPHYNTLFVLKLLFVLKSIFLQDLFLPWQFLTILFTLFSLVLQILSSVCYWWLCYVIFHTKLPLIQTKAFLNPFYHSSFPSSCVKRFCSASDHSWTLSINCPWTFCTPSLFKFICSNRAIKQIGWVLSTSNVINGNVATKVHLLTLALPSVLKWYIGEKTLQTLP